MEAKLKHLEFIQAAISRMAQNSFLFKGWAITVAAGLSAFGAANTKHALLAIALVSTLLFWALDGYYLWLERGYIRLWEKVVADTGTGTDFNMRPVKSARGSNRFTCWLSIVWAWLKTCFRPHLVFFYGVIAVIDAIGIFVIKGSK